MPQPAPPGHVHWNLQPPSADPHAYFNQWAADPHCVQVKSLRDDAQLDSLAHPAPAAPGWVYDASMDAAKGTVLALNPADADVKPQLWVVDPTVAGTLTFVWDTLIPSDVWATESSPGGWPQKAFQTTKDISGGGLGLNIETRFQRLLTNQLPVISCVDWRAYSNLGPGAFKGASPAPCNNSDTVQPRLAQFMAHADVWMRFIEHIALNGLTANGIVYDLWSLWVGDENRDFLHVYDNIPVEHAPAGVKGFAFEYDSSQPRGIGDPPASIYNRDFLMLRGLTDVTPLLVKPIH